MDFTDITKLSSTIILASFLAFLISAGPNPAYAQHTVTINNYCSETIWVGAFPNVQSVTVGGMNVTTLGGWEMTANQSGTVMVPGSWSGRFWARTGCNFNNSGVCDNQTVKVNNVDRIIANCCDTGGCTGAGGKYVLNCVQTGLPPSTLAELTVVASGQDSYDVSMVDGGNISVEIIPSSSTYTCTGNGKCINTLNLPGKNSATCSTDSDCYPLFGDGYKWKCDPNMKLCVNPFFCGSPGCTDTSGCAPDGIAASNLPSSSWTGTDLAVSQSSCLSELVLNSDQNQGSTYVGCFAPQKFCRKACSADGDCGPPYTFNCGSSGYCEESQSNPAVLGADCDSTVAANGQTSATTKEQLWACTGVNAGSCFSSGTNANCCGCPSWAPGYPNGACLAGNNPSWQSVAQPVQSIFNDSSPTTYTFPYDDTIKLFMCEAATGQTTAYTVNFCPNDSDGDGVQRAVDTDADGDGITNEAEAILTTQSGLSSNREEILVGTLDDADADGLENWYDLDSDNDGVPDHTECGGTADSNSDGLVDDQTDADGDGLPDVVDPSQGGAELNCADTDGDGLPDFIDIDSDDQGGTDFEENRGMDSDGDGLPDSVTDENQDGLLDIFDPDTGEPLVIRDSDNDGVPNYLDTSDGSGGGGCSIAPHGAGMTPSAILWLLLPALILIRRFVRIY